MIPQYLCVVELMNPLFSQGLTLMVYGMTTVVLFLLLLVLAMRALAWFVKLTAAESTQPASASAAKSGANPDVETVAAITAAIQRYRKRS
jgi:oxaloacetate decarboxylase gamma subunit